MSNYTGKISFLKYFSQLIFCTPKMKQSNLFSRLPSILNDIRRLNAKRNKNETRVDYMRKRVVELGGKEKKEFLPFKSGLTRIEEKKEKKKFSRTHGINSALLRKRKSNR